MTFQYGPLHSIYVQVKMFLLLAYLKSNCVGYHIYSEDPGYIPKNNLINTESHGVIEIKI